MTLAPTLPRELTGIAPAAAARELQTRRAARASLLDFTRYTFPDYQVSWHHRVIAHFLDLVLAGAIPRLIVTLPPQHGKTELVSRRLPAYALGRNPDAHVILASYSSDLANLMSRDAQRIIDSAEYGRLFPETRLADESDARWTKRQDFFEVVDRRGSLRAAGVGGGITGLGFHLGIIDDPVKNREEAESEVVRAAQWRWYTSTFRTRATETGAAIVVLMTRWHEDDLVGRLLATAAGDPKADQWTVLSLPALAEEPGPRTVTVSRTDGPAAIETIDERAIGEVLWAERFSLNAIEAVAASLGSYDFAALYQQRPAPAGGGMFQREWLTIVDAGPSEADVQARVRYWDKAGTEGGGAYSAGVLMALGTDGRFYVEDVVRAQLSAGGREALIKQTAALDGVAVEVWTEQEPGSGGKESAENTIRGLAGYDVHAEPVTGDKVTRARPFAAQAEAGNVRLLRGPWNGPYLDELGLFPNGRYKDQVDASSGAFNKLALANAALEIYLPEPVRISDY